MSLRKEKKDFLLKYVAQHIFRSILQKKTFF